MRAWNLTRTERVLMWTRLLMDLAENPDGLLFEAIQRPILWVYRFQLGNAPHRRFFSFAVERRDYVGELHVLDGAFTNEGDPTSP